MAELLLEVVNIKKHFGGFKALDGVNLTLNKGEVIGLVGPNGSGKTTLVNIISGVYKPSEGEVILDGKKVSGLKPHKVAGAGINRSFQIPRPFKDLTVLENLLVAMHNSGAKNVHLLEILSTTHLDKLAHRKADSLTAAQQKRLDLARALATNPQVLLVDELGAGLNPAELDEIRQMLKDLSDRGVAMLVVEHLLGFLSKVTNKVIVLDAGREIFAGSLEDAIQDPQVVEVFLGG